MLRRVLDLSLSLPPLPRETTQPDETRTAYLGSREWLATNGLGGYASGTLLGQSTRRYHSLFVPNLPAPHGRIVMLPRLDEELTLRGKRHRFSRVEFADGRVEGDAAKHLEDFRLDMGLPRWRYRFEGALLEKRIVMPHLANTVYIEYRLANDSAPARLDLRPFVTFRGHDGRIESIDPSSLLLTIARQRYELHFPSDRPPLRLVLRGRRGPEGVFVVDERLSREVFYPIERERGHDAREDLYSPGAFSVELRVDQPIALIASTESWEALETPSELILHAEHHRYERLIESAPDALQAGWAAQLVLAADQFIVLPGSRLQEEVLARAAGDETRTVIAGYHWFTDWGRDTMIALEGLTLVTGRPHEARAILRTFAHYITDGLLPNRFLEGQSRALYNTADATLWYFHALDAYYRRTNDRETLELLYPTLASVVAHHTKGTAHGIGMDARDGLLRASQQGEQLTWMDAKVDDWVVTPRRGKPIEIQALWYNALRLMAEWARALGEASGPYETLAARVHDSFNARFWNDARQHCYDVVDGDAGDDPTFRPNQIFAIALNHPVLAEPRWRPVMAAVQDRLLTPVGLRTLAPGHPDYKPSYAGDLRARDAAYHQGTVWPWLIGPYIDAWLRVYGPTDEARGLLDGLRGHLHEAGVGSISEIFDADPPYRPRGCIAQAWSVAEVLRAFLKLNVAQERRGTS